MTNAEGDIRAAVRDLQSVATGRTEISAGDTAVLSGRENRNQIHDVLSAVYRYRDPALARERYDRADTDPGMLLLWLSENMHNECTDTGSLVRVSGCLSRADLYLAMVRKRMQYGFWSYALDMMLVGVPTALRDSEKGTGMFRFPTYLSRMSRAKSVRAIRTSAGQKLGVIMHTSAERIMTDTLPQLRIMLTEDAELRSSVVRDAKLEPEELAYILGVDATKKIVKDCYAAPKPRKKDAVPEEKPPAAEPAREPASPPKGQTSFADFM